MDDMDSNGQSLHFKNMESKPKLVSRYGAYGVLLKGEMIFLSQKKSGPYKGLWGLPGGGIEFGETPEETLKRELMEEAAFIADKLHLFSIATSVVEYEKLGENYRFHHIGIIYKVSDFSLKTDVNPEEEGHWFMIKEICLSDLTPFAKHAWMNLCL